MNSIVRSAALLGLYFYKCCFVTAAQTTVHSLTVAANSALLLDNDAVDRIIKRMNDIIAKSSYPWDIACPSISFKRSGDVINIDDYNFLTTGTFDQLRDALHKYAPSANVMVVSTINCNGVTTAKGCATVGEPLIVGQMPDPDEASRDPQLWLHERGHNVGLNHSADRPASETSVPPSIGLRFMFWSLGWKQLGKIADECAHYENAAFASVSKSFAVAANQHGFSALQLVTNDTATSSMSTPLAPADSVSASAAIIDEAHKLGLTDSAFNIVGLPWEDNAPYEDIKALSETDINSIRGLFQKAPNQFWPQAIQVLAIADGADDLPLIQNALNLPMPEVSSLNDRSAIRQNRIIREIKSVVPMALAIIANKTKSKSASDTLISIANMNNAQKIIGKASALSLSKSAIAGMFVADTTEANEFLNSAVGAKIPVNDELNRKPGQLKLDNFQSNVFEERPAAESPANKPNDVPPISPEELDAMTKNHDRIRSLGLESVLKGKVN
jgi:hypothetical protein